MSKFASFFFSLMLSLPAFSQELPCRGSSPFGGRFAFDVSVSLNTDCVPVKYTPPATVDLTQFLIPDQKYSDALQYHFAGYGHCFQDTPECRDSNGVPIRQEGGYWKVARADDSSTGDTRFIFQKAPSHPNEYYIVKNELDAGGKPVQIVYIETEAMDWGGNQSARSYHTDTGYPTFEWGRSNALLRNFNPQYIGTCTWTYCGEKPDESYPQPSTPSGYVPRVYDLSGDLDAINKDLAELGPIEPEWLNMAKELGKDPQLLVYYGYWSPVTERVFGNDPTLWRNREIYFYLKGIGIVGWRWQEHVDGNILNPFLTLQEGIAYKTVYEDEPILPLAVCEKVPQ